MTILVVIVWQTELNAIVEELAIIGKKIDAFSSLVDQVLVYGGRDKVEFYKVDKLFWHTFLVRNWQSRIMSTENEYSVWVDIDIFSYVDLICKLIFLCRLLNA